MTTLTPITQVIPSFTVTPLINTATFPEDIDKYNTEMPAVINAQQLTTNQINRLLPQLNTLETKVSAMEASAVSASAAAVGAANYQGTWTSKGYTVGQTVSDVNGIRWLCKLTHTTAQIAAEGTYWTIAIPYVGAIGNINSPLLDMPLKNSLAMKSGVGSATFTRASTATYIDRYGMLNSAAIDEPRFEKEGYLNEGASTNLLTYSEQFDVSSWTKSASTIVPNTTDTLDPYGTNLAYKLLDDTTASIHQVYQAPLLVIGTTYTSSIYVKAGTAQYAFLRLNTTGFGVNNDAVFNFATKVITVTNGTAISSVVELPNGWFRISITATATASVYAPIQYGISLYGTGLSSTSGTGATSLYIFGAQLEALPFATSYIPTVASTVTRSADTLNATLVGNTPRGYENKTIIIDFTYYGTNVTTGQGLFSFDDIAHNMLRVDANSNKLSLYYHAVALFSTPLVVGNSYRAAYVISGNSKTSNTVKLYLNGILIGTQSGVAPVLIQPNVGLNYLIAIGRFGGDKLKIKVSNFRVYDIALTAQEVALA